MSRTYWVNGWEFTEDELKQSHLTKDEKRQIENQKKYETKKITMKKETSHLMCKYTQYYTLRKKIIDSEIKCAIACNDPNYNPDECLTEVCRKAHAEKISLMEKAATIEIPEWIAKFVERKVKKYAIEAWKAYNELPWVEVKQETVLV
jgi:hypothetical protein